MRDLGKMVTERCDILPLSMDVLVKRKSDHKRAIWKALKGSFSFYEDKEAESFGGCLERNL